MSRQQRNDLTTIHHSRIAALFSFLFVAVLPGVLFASPRLLPARSGTRLAQIQADKSQNRQQARELAQKGSAAFANKDLKTAQKYYEEAYALYPANIILYSLGRAYEEDKKWLRAYSAYQQFVDTLTTAEQSSQQARDARTSIRIVESHLGRLKVESDTPALRYRIDDELEFRAGAEPVRLDPGEHRLLFGDSTQTVTIKEGETLIITLSPSPQAAPIATVPPVAAPPVPSVSETLQSHGLSRNRKIAAGVLGSLALLSLGTGIALTVLDGRETPGQCALPGSGPSSSSVTTCVYDTRAGYALAYGATGALTVGLILALALPPKRSSLR